MSIDASLGSCQRDPFDTLFAISRSIMPFLELFNQVHFTHLSLACAFLASSVASWALYNIWLHPLARIPGPWLAKCTDLWHVFQLWGGNRHHVLHTLHLKHGPLVRVGPNTVSANSAEALSAIYPAGAPIIKSPFYQAFTRGHDSSFTTLDSRFKEKKSVILQAFSSSNLQAMEPIMRGHVDHLCELLLHKSHVNIDEALSALTVDIMSDVCFGESFRLLDDEEERTRVSQGLTQAAKLISLEGTLWKWPVFGRLNAWLTGSSGRGYSAQKAIQAMMRQRANPSGRLDIFTNLLNATQPGTEEPYSDRDLFGEAIVLLVAGSDTTSSALTTIIWHLIRHPKVYEKATHEIRNMLRNNTNWSYEDLQNLTYVKAVVEESLRIISPNPGLIPRLVVPSKRGLQLHGVPIPDGTEIGVANMSLHRNPDYFEMPDEFIPERWLSDGLDVKGNKDGFAPFSRGPRACPGRSMAYMEIMLCLVAVFSKMDLHFQDADLEAGRGFRATDAFVFLRPTVSVVVTPRNLAAP